MRKIVLLIIVSAFNSYAQVPGVPYAGYEFTNGSLNNSYNTNGSSLINGVINPINVLETDRFGIYGNAIVPDGFLVGTGTPNTDWFNASISFWVKRSTNLSGNKKIIDLRNGNGLGFSIELDHNSLTVTGQSLAIVNNPASITTITGSSSTNIYFGSQNGIYHWHHVVVNINRDSFLGVNDALAIEVYVDGVKRMVTSGFWFNSQNQAPITNFLKNTTLWINQNNDFEGSIDDVYLYNSVLSNAEVNALFTNINTTTLVNSINVNGIGGLSTISGNTSTLQMQADVLPINATNSSYSWSVVNGTGSATINANGVLTAQSNGNVTVIATANDASGISGTKVISISDQIEQSYNTFMMRQQLSDSLNTSIDDIILYPNPNKGILNFSSDEFSTVFIYNMNGQKVLESTRTLSLNIRNLNKGVYMVKLLTTHGEILIKKLIKE